MEIELFRLSLRIVCDLDLLRAPKASNGLRKLGRHKFGGVSVGVTEWASETKDAFEQFQRQARDRLEAVDVNQDGSVDMEEARAPHAFDMSGLVSVADRNRDGLLSSNELEQWIELQSAFTTVVVQVRIKYWGTSLFAAMDLDMDERISPREMARAKEEIPRLIDSDDIPVRMELLTDHLEFWTIEIAGGRFLSDRPKIDFQVPYWFRGMDRNRDGDVEPHEFLGSEHTFNELDKNRDGFLCSEELN